MVARTDLYDDILRAAGELFMKQSYAATSIKQIAKAAGCTTAALYYYFEDGKESILRQVIDDAMPDLAGYLEPLQGVESLHELILRVGLALGQVGEDMMHRTRWLMVEFPNMGEAERAKLHQKLIQFQRRLADLIEPFVASRQQAELLAWVEYAALFGYGQLVVTLDLQSAVEPPGEAFVLALADMIEWMGKKAR
jgi:AcrR family transcriptional regulator